MNRAPLLSSLLLVTIAASPVRAEDMVIEGVRLSQDFACTGQNVIVAGQGNAIGLKGECGVVQVIGADHKLSFETASALQISGASITATGGAVGTLAVDLTDNRVTATISAKGALAEVRIFGADQKAELRFAGPAAVTVGGSSNELVWTLDGGVKAPAISALGVDLRIKRK